MALALVGIGIPGSGKTTYLKKLSEDHGFAYINKDSIREELLGDIKDQSQNRRIWIESNRRIEEALAHGTSVVIDSTHAESWKRKELVTFLRRSGAVRVIALYFDVPYEIAHERNQARNRVVKEKQMHWFQGQIEEDPPSLDEGFDRIYTLKDTGALEEELA